MVQFRSRSSGDRSEAIIHEAESAAATLIVMGVSLRPSEAMLFGETANRLLEESASSLLFVAS
jgi:nucleotide-binding universal stress UspA family protein